MSTQPQRQAPPSVGGLVVSWLLAAPVRSFVSKVDNKKRTVFELRDPARLGNSLVVFLDGEPGTLAAVPPNTRITLRLDEVRSGRGRGELVGSVPRAVVEQAFAAVAGGAS